MITEKERQKAFQAIRSSYVNKSSIKVVYLGRCQGFNWGEVIEAKACAGTKEFVDYPYPQQKYVEFRIEDEDGDLFTVSEDGKFFSSGWFPIPDKIPYGPLFDGNGKFKFRCDNFDIKREYYA